jgi:dTDP-glucose 4,6-dehydratase
MSQANRLPVIIINKLLNGEEINLHIDEHGQVGGRRWLYAGDVASQTRYILTHQIGKCEKWNSSGRDFINNFELADKISNIMNKELSFKFSQIERLGHGTHFSPSPDKIYKAGWTEPLSFDIRLKETVEWYLKNPEWLTRN